MSRGFIRDVERSWGLGQRFIGIRLMIQGESDRRGLPFGPVIYSVRRWAQVYCFGCSSFEDFEKLGNKQPMYGTGNLREDGYKSRLRGRLFGAVAYGKPSGASSMISATLKCRRRRGGPEG